MLVMSHRRSPTRRLLETNLRAERRAVPRAGLVIPHADDLTKMSRGPLARAEHRPGRKIPGSGAGRRAPRGGGAGGVGGVPACRRGHARVRALPARSAYRGAAPSFA